jgi:hypothetical protein
MTQRHLVRRLDRSHKVVHERKWTLRRVAADRVEPEGVTPPDTAATLQVDDRPRTGQAEPGRDPCVRQLVPAGCSLARPTDVEPT